MKNGLEEIGKYEVVTANNGKVGFNLAIQEKPDLIITDVIMPEMNGEEMAKSLSQNPKTCDIPLIFLTATVDQQKLGMKRMAKLGGHNYIAKPISIAELDQCIEEVLGNGN